jgi:hypothetical protein
MFRLLIPWDKLQVGHVYSDLAGKNQLIPGVDTRQGPIENWNGGRSGYYLRKFIDPTLDPQYVKQDIPFRHIRYAEVLLNYAEACIEENTGSDLADATTYINMIRTRAGQPGLASGLSQAALRTAVRHERRVELAFENHRFWDVRRWVIGPDAYKPTHRVDVKYVTPAAGPIIVRLMVLHGALRFIPTHFWLKKQDHGMHQINVISSRFTGVK